MTGRLFAVVGPSGAGKDTLIAAVARARPDLHIVRRVITRPAELGGEPFESVSAEEFEARRGRGDFLFAWQAHGLCYGIFASVRQVLDAEADALFNGSRAMLAEAARTVRGLRVLHISATRDVLVRRLIVRGRETPDDIRSRLDRPAPPLPPGLRICEIDNSGALSESLERVLAVLQQENVL